MFSIRLYRRNDMIRNRCLVLSRRWINTQGNPNKDYYGLLGIAVSATQREIKSAYYTLSKKYHPDVAGSSAESKFLEVNEAYECLKDPERRRAYDNMRSGARGPRYTGDHGYQGDPFQEFYKRAAQQQWQYQQSYGSSRSKRYSQQDYERIWEEFRRMSDKQKNDPDWERQRIWEELARKRAERWREFSRKYPDGPPGGIKWQFSWGGKPRGPINNTSNTELLRRITIVYIVVFAVVTVVQVIMQTLGDGFQNNGQPRKATQPNNTQEKTDRERIMQMVNRSPEENSPHSDYSSSVGNKGNGLGMNTEMEIDNTSSSSYDYMHTPPPSLIDSTTNQYSYPNDQPRRISG